MLWLLLFACTDPSPNDSETGEIGSELLAFTMPIRERELIQPRVIGMDHDPEEHTGAYQVLCKNYEGNAYPYCYI